MPSQNNQVAQELRDNLLITKGRIIQARKFYERGTGLDRFKRRGKRSTRITQCDNFLVIIEKITMSTKTKQFERNGRNLERLKDELTASNSKQLLGIADDIFTSFRTAYTSIHSQETSFNAKIDAKMKGGQLWQTLDSKIGGFANGLWNAGSLMYNVGYHKRLPTSGKKPIWYREEYIAGMSAQKVEQLRGQSANRVRERHTALAQNDDAILLYLDSLLAMGRAMITAAACANGQESTNYAQEGLTACYTAYERAMEQLQQGIIRRSAGDQFRKINTELRENANLIALRAYFAAGLCFLLSGRYGLNCSISFGFQGSNLKGPSDTLVTIANMQQLPQNFNRQTAPAEYGQLQHAVGCYMVRSPLKNTNRGLEILRQVREDNTVSIITRWDASREIMGSSSRISNDKTSARNLLKESLQGQGELQEAERDELYAVHLPELKIVHAEWGCAVGI
ncbi:MAG: hypothetical protein GY710_01910 [Desulfobacteraceae bacterium]|nr:hypothetical protein [Desulfobacteraceae bacterium]